MGIATEVIEIETVFILVPPVYHWCKNGWNAGILFPESNLVGRYILGKQKIIILKIIDIDIDIFEILNKALKNDK